MCLFHHEFGGALEEDEFVAFPHEIDGPAIHMFPIETLQPTAETLSYLVDPYDWELFQYAKAEFVIALTKYDLLR